MTWNESICVYIIVGNPIGFIFHKIVQTCSSDAAGRISLKSYRREATSIYFVMLGMLKEYKWTSELALCLITISVIIRNSEGHSYQSEDTTGNCEHMLNSFTRNSFSADVTTQFNFSFRCMQF
jgi:hypothetical protein